MSIYTHDNPPRIGSIVRWRGTRYIVVSSPTLMDGPDSTDWCVRLVQQDGAGHGLAVAPISSLETA